MWLSRVKEGSLSVTNSSHKSHFQAKQPSIGQCGKCIIFSTNNDKRNNKTKLKTMPIGLLHSIPSEFASTETL